MSEVPTQKEAKEEDSSAMASSSIKPSSQEYLKFFRDTSEEKRRNDAKRILDKFPDRVPIILVPAGKNAPSLTNHKYLAPKNITLGQFMISFRTKMTKMEASDALYLFVSDKKVLCSSNELMGKLYEKYVHSDSFMYVYYSLESTFG